jgi:glucose/mannose-6-phosphate isomerase
MTSDILKKIAKQFTYEPVIENLAGFTSHKKFIVCGMGGSNLAAGIIKDWQPKLDVIMHRDFGLPALEEKEFAGRLVIVSSYSGNTAETISAFEEALARNLPIIAIAAAGKVLELAKERGLPFIQMPKIAIEPRFAFILSIKATLKAMSKESILIDIAEMGDRFNIDTYEQSTQSLTDGLKNKIPVIYSSNRNLGLAYYWKINLNETSKIPAFFNTFPELNHNEMSGFGLRAKGANLSDKFAFVFLNDPDDKTSIQKRMSATAKIFEEMGLTVLNAELNGPSLWHKSFAGILTALATSFHLAEYYAVDPEDNKMIEDFKKALRP